MLKWYMGRPALISIPVGVMLILLALVEGFFTIAENFNTLTNSKMSVVGLIILGLLMKGIAELRGFRHIRRGGVPDVDKISSSHYEILGHHHIVGSLALGLGLTLNLILGFNGIWSRWYVFVLLMMVSFYGILDGVEYLQHASPQNLRLPIKDDQVIDDVHKGTASD